MSGHHYGQYHIESKQDYIEYLHGKILWRADDVSYEAWQRASEYLQRVRTVDELEGYLVDLEVLNESQNTMDQLAGI